MVSIRGREFAVPQLLLIGLAVVLAGALLVAASTSTAAFSAYNSAWDGTSTLRDVARDAGSEPVVALRTEQYADVAADRTTAVILSPDAAYSRRDATRVREFVRQGGTVVVAEDFGGHTNRLLAAVGAQARVDGRLLRDERYNYRSPNITVATGVRPNRTLTAGVDQLTLNHGTAIRPNGATPVVNSSAYGYLDGNENGQLDDTERLDSYPVVTTESVGDGRVVVVSDPSLFINAMAERPGNAAFMRNLAANAETLLLDYSHVRSVPPLVALQQELKRSPGLQLLVGFLGIGGIALAFAPVPVLRRLQDELRARRRSGSPAESAQPPDPERLRRDLKARYPYWDDDSVRHVTTRSLKGDDSQERSIREDI